MEMAEIIASPSRVQNTENRRPRLWRELAFYAALAMELSWVVLWSRLLLRAGPQISYGRIFLVMGGILLTTYAVASASEKLNLRMILRRFLLGIVLLLGMVVGLELLVEEYGSLDLWELLSRPVRTFRDMTNLVPIEFIVMLLVLALGWRGMSLVGSYIEPQVVIGGFRLGIFALFLYGILAPVDRSAPLGTLVIFLFSSLLAMSAARIAILGHLRGGQTIPFDRRWLGGVLLAVSAMVGIAWLVATSIQGAGFEVLSRVFTVLLFILVIVLSPLLWLVFRLILALGEWLNLTDIIGSILEFFKGLQAFFDKLIAAISGWFERINTSRVQDMIQILQDSKPILLWGTIIVLLIMVLLSIQRHLRRREAEPDEQEYESLLAQKDLFGLLKDAFRRSLDRMMEGLDKMSQLRLARRLLAAARIRRIYARLMDLSARLDQPRPASRTPLEFLPNLETLFPNLGGELQTITNAYLRVRYGDLPEIKQEIEEVEYAWRRISLSGQDLLRSRPKKGVSQ